MIIDGRVEEVTPAIAGKLLEKNSVNRPINRQQVKTYARAIAQGLWQLNGEPIIISSDGSLLNGQHRCLALIEAAIPIRTVVVRGVEKATFSSMDSGRVRRFGDVLGISGEQDRFVLAGATSWLWRYLGDKMSHGTSKPTNAELEATLEKHPGLRASLNFIGAMDRIGELFPKSLAVLGHYVFSLDDPAAANEFFSRLDDGVGLTKDNPIYALRERFITRRKTKKYIHSREFCALMIKAWNSYRSGDNVVRLRYGKNEKFPRAVA